MLSRLRTLGVVTATSVFVSGLGAAASHANGCNQILAQLPEIDHGSIVFKNRKHRFEKFTSSTRRNAVQNGEFWYISRERENDNGILVIKSGEAANNDSTSDLHISLERKIAVGDRRHSDSCYASPKENLLYKEYKAMMDKEVPLEVYEGYHQYGEESGVGTEELRNFHVTYESNRSDIPRSYKCIRTDENNRSKTGGYFDGRATNRHRFSFDRNVVENGTNVFYAAFRRVASLSTVLAGSEQFSKLRVQMLPFAVAGKGTMCLRFRISGWNSNSILRVSDIDDIAENGHRTPESDWSERNSR